MRVIVCASQKGGSGKTTLSGHIAVQAERQGAGPVAIIDTDPQGSLAEWWNSRTDDSPLFAKTTLDKLEQDLAALQAGGVRLAVIDTPPSVTAAIRQVMNLASLVVIPIRPSPHDLRAAAATVDLAETLDRSFVFVVNGATARARITADAAVTLSQHGTVAPVTLHHRTDFASSMIDGRTVMECDPRSRSAAEVVALWDYLASRLEKAAQRGLVFDGAAPFGASRASRTFGRRLGTEARI